MEALGKRNSRGVNVKEELERTLHVYWCIYGLCWVG